MTATARMPEMHPVFQVPVWYHHHGDKMALAAKQIPHKVILDATAAKLKLWQLKPEADGVLWMVEWQVVYSKTERVDGCIAMNTNRIRLAFGLTKEPDEADPPHAWLVERFGGTVGYQGCFLRHEQWVNFPGPGTGHDGDPNISLELRDPIKAAVHALLSEAA